MRVPQRRGGWQRYTPVKSRREPRLSYCSLAPCGGVDLTIWWARGFHCLTCGAFTLKGCKEHRAGNIPAKAIIEATLADVRILSDRVADMIVAELKGSRDQLAADESLPESPDEPGDLTIGDEGGPVEEAANDETVGELDHFLVSKTKKEFTCSCGRKFGSEHVLMSHIEMENQLSSVGNRRSRNSLGY